MDLRSLRYFILVADNGSINRTSRDEFISQQGLNRIIQKLEKELDRQLFVRTSQGVQLTASGRIVYQYATDMLALDKMMMDDLGIADEMVREQIWISFFYCTLDHLSSQFINVFRLLHSDIDLLVGEHPFSVSERQILEEKYDLAIGYAPIDPAKFVYTSLKRVNWPILIHKSNPLSLQDSISLLDLAEQQLFLMSNNFKSHNVFLQRCQDLGMTLNIVGTVNNLAESYQLVQQNKGVTFGVSPIFQPLKTPDVVEVPLIDDVCYSDIGIFYKKGLKLRPAVQKFFDYTCECASRGFLMDDQLAQL